MKKMIRNEIRVLLNLIVAAFLLMSIISCSGSGPKKCQKDIKKTPVKMEKVSKDKPFMFSKTTCTDCHRMNSKGELVFPEKGKEGAKPPETGGSTH